MNNSDTEMDIDSSSQSESDEVSDSNMSEGNAASEMEEDGYEELRQLGLESEESDSDSESNTEHDDSESGSDADSEHEAESDISEEDPDNPSPFSEPEDYSVEDILRILMAGKVHEDEPPLPYKHYDGYEDVELIETNSIASEHDYAEIVERASEGTLQQVFVKLYQDDFYYNDNLYFEDIKKLAQEANISIEDGGLLEHYLKYAIKHNDESAIDFLIEQGAGLKTAKNLAIQYDSRDALETLGVEATKSNIRNAAMSGSISAVDYFLKQDFLLGYEIVLAEAADESNSALVEVVCDYVEFEYVYDVIKCLIKEGGEELVHVFFDKFPPMTLLPFIYEQDHSGEFYEIIFNAAKEHLSKEEIAKIEEHDLIVQLDEKLKLGSTLSILPQNDFRGSRTLKKVRDAIFRKSNLSHENKVAANLIGISLSPANNYLSQSPYHPDPERSGHYFRSHLWQLFTKYNARFKPHASLPETNANRKMGGQAHLGLYRTPLDVIRTFMQIEETIESNNSFSNYSYPDFKAGNSKMYDNLLVYKRKICSYIEEKFGKPSHSAIKVGFYNQYPCVMVYIEKPSRAANISYTSSIEAWAETVTSYFVGLVNYTAEKANLDVELLRKPSFGFLRPTIAVCGQSFRLEIGIIPIDYADILVRCLRILNHTLKILNRSADYLRQLGLNLQLPDACFVKDPSYRQYMHDKKMPIVSDVLELGWAGVDRGYYSGMYNLNRSLNAQEGFAAKIYESLATSTAPSSYTTYAQAFLTGLQWGFSRLEVIIKKGQLHFSPVDNITFKKLITAHAIIKDANFFEFIGGIIANNEAYQKHKEIDAFLVETFNDTLAAIKHCIRSKILARLYFHLETLNELLYSMAILISPKMHEDDFGSDSEIEDKARKIYAKKVIVQNGMRAILGALHAGSNYLFPKYLTQDTKNNIFLYGPYYETTLAANLIRKFKVLKDKKHLPKANILIYDINSCGNDGAALPVLQYKDLVSIKVLIIDSTSATIEEQNHWLKIFESSKAMKVLFFVSSGFKNEQNGADKNPYGTIRVFTKCKKTQKTILSFIKEKEEPIKTQTSHNYRRLMREMGNTPRNATITFFSNPNANTAAAPAIQQGIQNNCNNNNNTHFKASKSERSDDEMELSMQNNFG